MALAKWRSGELAFFPKRNRKPHKCFVRKSQSATFSKKWRTGFVPSNQQLPDSLATQALVEMGRIPQRKISGIVAWPGRKVRIFSNLAKNLANCHEGENTCLHESA
jgi:hypothetical protein